MAIFIAANTNHTGGANGTITRVVIHGTVSPCQAGGARGNANYFQSAGAGGAAHYVVDPAEVVQCISEDTVGYHAPPNRGSIGVELCDPQTGAGGRWGDANHTAMLVLAAGLVRDICVRHNLPVAYVDSAGLLAGHTGITTHNDVSRAWHQSDHSDPGPDFPMAHFLDLVRGAAAPTPTPTEDPDMALLYVLPDKKTVFVADTQSKRQVATPEQVAYMRRNGLAKDQDPIPLVTNSEHDKYLASLPFAPAK